VPQRVRLLQARVAPVVDSPRATSRAPAQPCGWQIWHAHDPQAAGNAENLSSKRVTAREDWNPLDPRGQRLQDCRNLRKHTQHLRAPFVARIL